MTLVSLLCESGHAQVIVPASGCNTCDGEAIISNAFGGNTTYQWFDSYGMLIFSESNSLGYSSVSGLCTGAYQVTIDTGFTVTESSFNIPTSATNPGTPQQLTLCSTDGPFDLNELLSDEISGGIWYDPAGNLAGSTLNPATTESGFYQYAIDEGGCAVATGAWIDIIQNADVGLSTTYLICENYNPFLLTDYLAGSPDYTGQWYAMGGIPMDGIFDPATMNTGLFTYMIDNVTGCPPVFSTMMVIENIIPDPGTDATVVVCAGSAPFNMLAELGGTPQAGGQWFDANDNPVAGVFDPMTSTEGIYRYHVNASTPCVGQDAFLTVIITNENPSGENGVVNVCETGAAFEMTEMLNGSPMAGGTWTDAMGTVVGDWFDPAVMVPGNYTYQHQGVGCNPDFALLLVNVEILPDAGVSGSQYLCESANDFDLNEMLSATADAGGQWFDTNGILSGSEIAIGQPGNYSFTYLAEGIFCPSDVALFSLLVEEMPQPLTDTTLNVCEASGLLDLNAAADAGLLTLNWFDANNQPSPPVFEPIIAGNYHFSTVLESGNSCPDEVAEISISVTAPDFTSNTVFIELCETTSAYDLNTSSTGIDFNTGIWTDETQAQIPNNILLGSPGITTYLFTSSQSAYCSASVLEVIVEVFEMPDAGTGSTIDVCIDEPAFNINDLVPPNATANGTWQYLGTTFTSPLFDPATDAAGTYNFVVDANGPCPSASAEVVVNIDPGIGFEAGEDIAVCSGEASVQIGQAPQQSVLYDWAPQMYLDDYTISNPTVTLFNPGTEPLQTDYVVFATNGVCTTSDTIQVMVYPLPETDAGSDIETCFETEIELTVNGGNTYYWMPEEFFTDNSLQTQNIVVTQDVVIEVEAWNNYQCSAKDSVAIIVRPLPDAQFEIPVNEACPPASFEIVNTSINDTGTIYIWNIAGEVFSGQFPEAFTIDESGAFDVTMTATTDQGCATTLTIPGALLVYENSIAGFSYNPQALTTLESTAQFINQSQNATGYVWSFGNWGQSAEADPLIEFPAEGDMNHLVCLEVVSDNGCTDTTCRVIQVSTENVFYAPNAFTPDGDGINDVFIPVFEGFDYQDYSFQVFDRWGEPVFESTEPLQPWIGNVQDGSYFAQPGVYVWQVKMKDLELADYRVFSGHISLIR